MRKSWCPRCRCVQPIRVGKTRNRDRGEMHKRTRVCMCVGYTPETDPPEYCGQVFTTEEKVVRLAPRRVQKHLF